MEVNVLGPLRVSVDGRSIPLGGRRQRAVLALLIAAIPDGVTMDRLVVGVYGPDASSSVHRSVRTYLSRFRAEIGRERIVRDGQRFRLVVDQRQVDAHRFALDVAEATALAATHPDRAAEQLRSALEAWSGEPFEDVDAYGLDAVVQRLDELRWAGIEQLADLDLALGRHQTMIANLSEFVAQRPWRERLCRAHALALVRSGRHAEALDACRRAADSVRTELGVEPGLDLRDLERSLTAAAISPLDVGVPARSVWRDPPARYTSFVGRTAELEGLAAACERHRWVSLVGTAGIGKSSLAAEAARASPRTVVWIPIETERDVAPVDTLAASIGMVVRRDVDTVRAASRVLGDEPTLLVFDGCERVLDDVAGLVHALLSACVDVHVLVTSRERLDVVGEHVIEVGPLESGPSSPAVELLLDRAAIVEPGDVELELCSQIVDRVDGHPLAIELAAAASRSTSLKAVVDRLGDQLSVLRARRSCEPRHRSLVAAIDDSFNRLDSLAQRSFCRLAVFPTGVVSVGGAQVVLERDDARDALDGLVERSMLSIGDEEGYRMLEPLRQYAEQRLTVLDDARAVERRHADWLITIADHVDDLMLGGHAAEGLERLRLEVPVITHVARRMAGRGEYSVVLDLVASIGRYWFRVADCALLAGPVVASIASESDRPRPRSVRGIAGAAILLRHERPDVAADLLRRLEDVDVPDHDHRAGLLVDFVRAGLVHTLDRRSFYGDECVAMRSLQLTESTDRHRSLLGYPPEPPSHGAAICLEALGRLAESEAVHTARALWAADGRPIERGIALEARAMLLTSRGDHVAAVADSREAVRLLAGLDVDFAASAELAGAWAHLNAGDYDAAAAALDRSDAFWQRVGLSPAEEDRPELVALIAAGRRRWDEFLFAARRFFEKAPRPEDGRDYELMLLGERGVGFHFARFVAPTAEWLIASGRPNEALALVAAAPSAFAACRFSRWDEIGETDRIRLLADQLRDTPPCSVARSLDELFREIDGLIRGA